MSSGARIESEHEWVEALGGLLIEKAWRKQSVDKLD